MRLESQISSNAPISAATRVPIRPPDGTRDPAGGEQKAAHHGAGDTQDDVPDLAEGRGAANEVSGDQADDGADNEPGDE